ncbi:MAG: sensor histidine kinase [Polyangia bacterium]
MLLVEDDDGIRESVAEILSDDGFDVRVARNGGDALTVLRREPAPDVILLDLMMPVMDGWQFRVEQKRDPLLAQIPVIAMSASTTSQARAIDAAAFASKPLRVDELRQTIERVVSRVRASRIEHTDRLAALGTVTAGVAHEISNPLTYVIANLHQLASELPAAVGPSHAHLPPLVSEALDGTQRITDILRNIQTLAHVTSDRTTALVDLRTCVDRAVKIVQHEVRGRAELRLQLDPVPPVRANAARLEQVIINLLTNAFRAVGDRARDRHVVAITTRGMTDRVRFEISDTGPGVPPHLAEQIFEPFFTTRPVGSGTGLGLSICRSIIQDAQGDIGVLAAPEGGALFWFELPALQSESSDAQSLDRSVTQH